MKIFFSAIFLCLAFVIGAVAQSVPKTPLEWMNLAVRQAEKREFDQAIKSASECLRLEQNQGCYLVRAEAYKAKGDLRQALADIDTANRIKPGNWAILWTRGEILRANGSLDAAIADLSRSIELNSGNLKIREVRGDVYFDIYERAQQLDTAKLDLAIADYTHILKIAPKQHSVLAKRGRANLLLAGYDEEFFEKALSDLDEAIKLEPKAAEYRNWRGQAHFGMKNDSLAIDDATAAIALNPRYSDAYTQRAKYNCSLKKISVCFADHTRAVELAPASAKPYFGRGQSYSDVRDHESAVKDFTKAIELEPKNPLYYASRASAYCSLGKKDLAKADEQTYQKLGGMYLWPCR